MQRNGTKESGIVIVLQLSILLHSHSYEKISQRFVRGLVGGSEAIGIGSVVLEDLNHTLHGVLHVPDATSSVISATKAMESNLFMKILSSKILRLQRLGSNPRTTFKLYNDFCNGIFHMRCNGRFSQILIAATRSSTKRIRSVYMSESAALNQKMRSYGIRTCLLHYSRQAPLSQTP
jgi:hypothetical protein